MKILAPLLLALLACSGSDAPTSSQGPEPKDSATDGADAADRVARIRALLRARHPSDLPDRAVLERHPKADESLRWLATHDETRIIRIRALALLRHYPDEETRALLLEVAGQAPLPSAIRAAALRGMQGFDLASQAELREELALHLGAADRMLATAAASTLAGQEGTAALVERAAADPALPAEAREAAARALASRDR